MPLRPSRGRTPTAAAAVGGTLSGDRQRCGTDWVSFRRPSGTSTQRLTVRNQLAADFPSRPDFRHDLIASFTSTEGGLLHTLEPGAGGTRRDYDQALTILCQLAAKFPSGPEFPLVSWSQATTAGAFCCGTRAGQRGGRGTSTKAARFLIRKQLAAEFPFSTRISPRPGPQSRKPGQFAPGRRAGSRRRVKRLRSRPWQVYRQADWRPTSTPDRTSAKIWPRSHLNHAPLFCIPRASAGKRRSRITTRP